MSPHERENLLKPYLPAEKASFDTPSPSPARRPAAKSPRSKKMPLRSFIRSQLHVFIYVVIHTLFSVYIRIRSAIHAVVNHILALAYYHHRSPELIRNDIRKLDRLPQHLSVILDFNDEEASGAGLEDLVNDVSEVAAWCASAGIPALSVYEKTGILKSYVPQTHRKISRTFESYFGPSLRPTLSLRAPHLPSYSPPETPPSGSNPTDPSTQPTHLTILLLSADDGRNTLVDLTKTLAEMSQRGKLNPADISAELVDAEITESVMGEPDLLLIFGPRVELKGYPPWQVRLTEIFHSPDNVGVNYQTFLKALHKYAKAQMRFGR
ncbi:Undecaprenyl diphosphate synthase [Saccharata proteae CBS 121410]|uniref:ditrans,polycis-polyprenyl diphosphate synthase [(2E,6E)-farnesyldiphosphate specific] n=1 Tax=Saccharata proteae CBS 121410 TaxID=1314787 RepID=A0A9P4LXN7_9PEZI|nr:Undecaprenyl diphosphate synthase [Saccharata proteae CBS 121410]